MSNFVKRYRFWLRNGFDVLEAAMQAHRIKDENFYKQQRRMKHILNSLIGEKNEHILLLNRSNHDKPSQCWLQRI